MKTIKIEIYSRGFEIGIDRITKEQYEFWSKVEDDESDLSLHDALNDSINWEESEVPESARFKQCYYDMTGIACAYGANAEYSTLVIKDGEEEIYNDELEAFFDEESGTEDNIEEVEYHSLMDLEPGYYLYWEQGGKGQYFEGEIEVEEFDPKLLTFEVITIEGNEVLSKVLYNNVEVDHNGGDWWGKYSDYSVHHIEGN